MNGQCDLADGSTDFRYNHWQWLTVYKLGVQGDSFCKKHFTILEVNFSTEMVGCRIL